MFRSLLLVIALTFGTTFSGTTFAATDIGDIFVPTEGDYSLYIIGKIFGPIDANVLPGEASASGPQLLGDVFRVFNIVTLGLGTIMVIYTLVVAVLQTAHHGKAMGEKMSSMWVPVRIAVAIALLVPKANGYCIAQVLVMWLVVQGVGAADSLWNVALDYFESGGSLGVESGGGGATQLNQSLNYVYGKALESLLVSAACVNSHNLDSNLRGNYEIYSYMQEGKAFLNFGRRPAANTLIIDNPKEQTYYECGRIAFNWFTSGMLGSQEAADAANLQHLTIMQEYVAGISGVGFAIANDYIPPSYDLTWDTYFSGVQADTTNYVTTMEGAAPDYFVNPDDAQLVEHIDVMRQGGWILAGNYYQVLASIEGQSIFNVNSDNTPAASSPAQAEIAAYSDNIEVAKSFYHYFRSWADKNEYTDQNPEAALENSIEDAMAEQNTIYNDIGFTQASVDHMRWFMDNITGAEGTVTDPILRAAKMGQSMMHTASVTMIALATTLPIVAIGAGICTASSPGGVIMNTTLATVLPITYGIMGFMYTQGAALAVFLPMIPFIIFAIGGIGWVFAVVEAMVAGPLIALGLTLPEDKGSEIYGRAEPAIMLLVNLFLRPSLMILGFISAILVAWLAVDLINICVENALLFGGVLTDKFFGHFIVSFMYVGLLVIIMTEVFTLITIVPDRVLRWVGDQSTSLLAAEKALQGGRSGMEQTTGQLSQTGQAVGGGYGRISGSSWERGFRGHGKTTSGGGGGGGGGAGGAEDEASKAARDRANIAQQQQAQQQQQNPPRT